MYFSHSSIEGKSYVICGKKESFHFSIPLEKNVGITIGCSYLNRFSHCWCIYSNINSDGTTNERSTRLIAVDLKNGKFTIVLMNGTNDWKSTNVCKGVINFEEFSQFTRIVFQHFKITCYFKVITEDPAIKAEDVFPIPTEVSKESLITLFAAKLF